MRRKIAAVLVALADGAADDRGELQSTAARRLSQRPRTTVTTTQRPSPSAGGATPRDDPAAYGRAPAAPCSRGKYRRPGTGWLRQQSLLARSLVLGTAVPGTLIVVPDASSPLVARRADRWLVAPVDRSSSE
jgi:hypothetical protein